MSNLHLLVTPHQGQHQEALRELRRLPELTGKELVEVGAPHSIDIPLGEIDARAAEVLAEKIRDVSLVARAKVCCPSEVAFTRRPRVNINRWED